MPDELRKFVDERAKTEQFSTPSEYVRHLIREDKKHQTIEAKLLEALDDGDLGPFSPDFFDRLRERLPKIKKRGRRGGR